MTERNRELLALIPATLLVTAGFAAVFVTTGSGHLVMFRSDSDAPIDLSAQAGSAPIFGEVGRML